MYLGLRVLAGALWAMAFTLLVTGMSADGTERRLSIYSWCIFLCFVATTTTIWLIFEHVLQRESAHTARLTADAVGEALGQVLTDSSTVTPITRRGT